MIGFLLYTSFCPLVPRHFTDRASLKTGTKITQQPETCNAALNKIGSNSRGPIVEDGKTAAALTDAALWSQAKYLPCQKCSYCRMPMPVLAS